MKKILFVLVLSSFVTGCYDPGKAKDVLVKSGYSDISIDGYGWFSCGKDDWYSTAFVAKSPNGSEVTGSVCSGFFKGNTIRLD